MRTKNEISSGRSRPRTLMLLGVIAAIAVGAYVWRNSTQSQMPVVNSPEASPPEARAAAPAPAVVPVAPAAPVAPVVAEKDGAKPFPDPENDAAEHGADPKRIAQRNAEEQRLRDLRSPPLSENKP